MTAINANPQVVVPPVIVQTPALLTLDPTNVLLGQLLLRLEQILSLTASSAPSQHQLDLEDGTMTTVDAMNTVNSSFIAAEGL